MVTFFLVLRPFPAYGLAALLIVTVFGVVSIAWSPGELDSALGLLLFVQMFLVSSGFVASARRGHYDPVLGFGCSRTTALAAHWCASMAPASVAWAVLMAIAAAEGDPTVFSSASAARLAALFIVSAVGSSVGFALPRGAGGVLWSALLVWLLLRHPDLLAWAGPETSTLGIARTAGAVALCPFLAVGRHPQITAAALAAASSTAAVALLLTWYAGTSLDVYLVERS